MGDRSFLELISDRQKFCYLQSDLNQRGDRLSFQSTGSLKFSYDGDAKQWLGEVENGSTFAT